MNFDFMAKWYPYFTNGILYTVMLAAFTVILGFILGMLLALLRLSNSKILKTVSGIYIEAFRCTPVYVQLLILYYGPFSLIPIPEFYLFGFIDATRFIPGIAVLSLNSGAYVAEIIRAGILAVDFGQAEASRSLGMTGWQTMWHVVLPQAIKNILPAIGNEFVVIIKESAICSTLGMQELMWSARTVQGATYKIYEPLLIAAGLYFVLTFPTSKLIQGVERRMRRGDVR